MILVDTHALIWLRTGDDRLGIAARRTLNDALRDGDLAVSAMTFWEVAMLKAKDRLEFPEDIRSGAEKCLDRGSRRFPWMAALRRGPGCWRTCTGTQRTELSSQPL